ncbi:MAG TPA: hypothetical protein VNK94_03780 [Gaiellaceae bacterium]|jgi:hypothetical protein|nr:hypothetical protein [Gaiellaceae bacterium]
MPQQTPADPRRVVELRRASLERAGYDPDTARALAERVEIPLRDALALRKAGYPPAAALAMLTSGSRPVF